MTRTLRPSTGSNSRTNGFMHEFSAYYKDHKDRVSASSTSGNQNATDQQEKKDPFLRSNKANRLF